MRRLAAPAAFVVTMLAASAQAGDAGAASGPGAHPFWKFPPVPHGLHPEFGGEDPIGLRAHSHIPTNCTINVQVENGKVFCFGSIASREMFLEAPKANEQHARDFLASESH